MTTYPGTDTRATDRAARAQRWTVRWHATRRAAKRAGAALGAARTRIRRPALTLSGLGCMAAAAYQVSLGVGLLATGIAVLLFEWVSD